MQGVFRMSELIIIVLGTAGMIAAFVLIYVLVAAPAVYIENKRNKKQPIVSAKVKVVNKRTYIAHGLNKYYLTFEILDSRRRIEFEVSGEFFGLIIDGDEGDLSYQGTQILNFQRQ